MSQRIIAITLGSNGFHLIEVFVAAGKIQPGTHLFEEVKAEAFVTDEDAISEQGRERILRATRQFSRYLESNPGFSAAAIATGTFRRTTNGRAIAEEISKQLKVQVQVLSGRDESLLSYMGMASQVGLSSEHRLVMDIGGGSTEIMIAHQNRLIEYESVDLGCVSLCARHFTDDKFTPDNFDRAAAACRETLAPAVARFQQIGWTEVLACGGSISALFSVMQQRRMCARFITPASLERFRDRVIEDGEPFQLCHGISPADRARTLPAAVSLIDALFRLMDIAKIAPVFSSVGQGLILQLARR